MATFGGITVNPLGQSILVTVTVGASGHSIVYADPAGTIPATNPATITTRTTFYLGAAGEITVSLKYQGSEVATAGGQALNIFVEPGEIEEITPVLNVPSGTVGTSNLALETVSPPPASSTGGSALGTSANAAHADHTHGVGSHDHSNVANAGAVAFGTAPPSTNTTGSVAGTGTSPARSDHAHAIGAHDHSSAPNAGAVAFGGAGAATTTAAGAAGAGTTPSRSDHTHQTGTHDHSNAANSGAVAFGGAGAATTTGAGTAGTATTPSHSDHTHQIGAHAALHGSTGADPITIAFAEYGDGSDGSLNFDGTTTVAGLVPASGVYTLTRALYATDLHVSGTGVIFANNWAIFASGTVTVDTGRSIHCNGNAGSGATAGALITAQYYGVNAAGGAGGAGTTGTVGAQATNVGFGGAGGAGGGSTGSGGSGGGRAGGAANPTTVATSMSLPRSLPGILAPASLGGTSLKYCGGQGGGGGDAAASSTGGGGGGGGGQLGVYGRYVVNNGSITATGGAGGNAAGTGTGAGGGGGGGGGVVYILSATYTGNAATANGGAGGAPQGAGNNGATGSAGTVFSLRHGF